MSPHSLPDPNNAAVHRVTTGSFLSLPPPPPEDTALNNTPREKLPAHELQSSGHVAGGRGYSWHDSIRLLLPPKPAPTPAQKQLTFHVCFYEECQAITLGHLPTSYVQVFPGTHSQKHSCCRPGPACLVTALPASSTTLVTHRRLHFCQYDK